MFNPYKFDLPDTKEAQSLDQTSRDPFTLQALRDWVATKPGEKIYCYMDAGRCLAAQYNKRHGREYVVPFFSIVDVSNLKAVPFDDMLEWISLQTPHTFAAALQRIDSAIQGKV